jgi:hypothetical protein
MSTHRIRFLHSAILACVALLTHACTRQSQLHVSTQAIADAATTGSLISLAEVVPQPWDTVFIFPPYTARDAYASVADGAVQSRVHESDSVVLLLFVLKGRAVGAVDLPRSPVDFTRVKGTHGIPRNEAIFKAKKDANGRTLAERA